MVELTAKHHQVGLIFGKFYPLHCGHIYLIEKAASQVDELHIILGCEAERDLALFNNSSLSKQPQVKDRYIWLQKTFKDRYNIHIHILDEAGIVSYPNGWQAWSERVKGILATHHVTPHIIFTSEQQDVDNHTHYFGCPVQLIDAKRDFMNISATEIRQHPYQNWSFIAKAARPFFVQKIALIGKEPFNQLAKQLANIYNTEYVSNGYINYIQREMLSNPAQHFLDETDYIKIAMLHVERMNQASMIANCLLFTSLDFQTLNTYYEVSFSNKSAVLQDIQKSYPFDLIINERDFAKNNSQSDNLVEIIAMIEKILT